MQATWERVPVNVVELQLIMVLGVAMKLEMLGAGTTLMVGELIDAKIPAALVTVRRKGVLEERGPVETPEPLPTLPTPLLMTPVPLQKLGNNSDERPLATVVTRARMLVTT